MLEDTHQGTSGEVVVARARDRDEAGFGGMLELAVTTARAIQDPAVIRQQTKYVAHFMLDTLGPAWPMSGIELTPMTAESPSLTLDGAGQDRSRRSLRRRTGHRSDPALPAMLGIPDHGHADGAGSNPAL